MPGLDLASIQPCTGMDLLQKLLLEALSFYEKQKQKMCSELATSFETMGLPAGFAPCLLIQSDFIVYISEGKRDEAIDSLLRQAGFPPHAVEILRDGYKDLEEKKKKDVENWAIQKGKNIYTEKLEPIVQEEVAKLLKCPPEETVLKLLNIVQNLNRVLNKITDKLSKVARAVNVTSVVISTTNTLLKAIKVAIVASDASMVAVAATPTGASGPIARAIGKLEQKVVKYAEDIDKLDKKVCAATSILQAIVIQVQSIQSLVETLETLLQGCLKGIELPQQIQQAQTDLSRFSINPFFYRGYRLEIRPDKDSPPIAQRRFAVAIDEYDIVVLQGPPSFSSSTDILIEELKYRIDNHLG